jgi:predicted secreted hydrolase
MRSKALCAAMTFMMVPAAQAPYQTAIPGYRYEFPRDYFDHPDFQTEWWYTTGNVKTADGRAFGFELTFFRQGVNRDESKGGAWDVNDIYLAHLALSDLNSGSFYHAERLNRAGPGVAGVNRKEGKVWNGNWLAGWKDGRQQLTARSGEFAFEFSLQSEKPPVIHGENGVSQKAEGQGRASHYVSQTRLATSGTIGLKGKKFEVVGLAWMDHEFFTHQLEPNQAGWDWFSIQLEDHTELMLFQLRRKEGTIDPYSAGTYVDAAGKTTHLRAEDFTLRPEGRRWKSSASGAEYPIEWRVAVAKLGIELTATTKLASQEFAGDGGIVPSYWEGAMQFSGKRGSAALQGTGYLEMTGYDRPVEMGR